MARHALLIGVSRFDDTRLAALNAPANDVQALGAILRDPARGGFDSVQISVDEECQSVRDRVGVLFGARDPEDLVLLYYSGHGILRRGNRLFLATPASDLDDPRPRSLPASEIREQMDDCRAQQQVLLLDCCHSGAFAEGTKGGAVSAVTDDTFVGGAEGRYVLTASDSQQFAWDGASMAEGKSADRHLSRFTSWLVDGLGTGAAAPDEPDITMGRLFRYVVQRARSEGAPSTPQSFVDRATGELVIGRNPSAAGEAEIASLVAEFAAADWPARLRTVEALARLARRPRTSEGAIDALAEQLASERDFKVRAAILKALQRPAEVEDDPSFGPTRAQAAWRETATPTGAPGPAPAATHPVRAAILNALQPPAELENDPNGGQSRTQAGKPQAAAPAGARNPDASEVRPIMTGIPQDSAPAREPRSAAPAAGPNPPLGAATTERPTTSPITPPGSTAAFKPGEIVQLTAAGIPAERWSSLPSAVIDLIRAQAVAVRNGRILVWTAWICVVLDLGVINLVGNKDPAGDPGGWLVLCQMIGGFMALVPGPWRAKRPPPKLPDEFAALAGRIAVVRFRFGALNTCERGRLRHGGWVLLLAGLLTLFVIGVIVGGRTG